jgi:hypothetical protein
MLYMNICIPFNITNLEFYKNVSFYNNFTRRKMLTCTKWKNSPIERSLASPKVGAKIGIRKSCDHRCSILIFTISSKKLKTRQRPNKLPVIQFLQYQKWSLNQQNDSYQNETEPLSNTAQEESSVKFKLL